MHLVGQILVQSTEFGKYSTFGSKDMALWYGKCNHFYGGHGCSRKAGLSFPWMEMRFPGREALATLVFAVQALTALCIPPPSSCSSINIGRICILTAIFSFSLQRFASIQLLALKIVDIIGSVCMYAFNDRERIGCPKKTILGRKLT